MLEIAVNRQMDKVIKACADLLRSDPAKYSEALWADISRLFKRLQSAAPFRLFWQAVEEKRAKMVRAVQRVVTAQG